MKYLEQRVEDLEREVQELKVKLFQKEFEETKNSWKETPYPNIWSSWDEILDSSDIPAYYPPANSEDVIEENVNEYGFKLNYEYNFDKTDKDYLEWLNKNPYKDSFDKNKKV